MPKTDPTDDPKPAAPKTELQVRADEDPLAQEEIFIDLRGNIHYKSELDAKPKPETTAETKPAQPAPEQTDEKKS